MRRNTLIKNAISSSPHDSQETASLNEDIERCSVPEDNTSPTPPSQVLAPTLQCDMVACCIWCLACNASN